MLRSTSGSLLCTGPIVEKPALLTRICGVSPRDSISPSRPARVSASDRSAGTTCAVVARLVGQGLELVGGTGDEDELVAATGEVLGDLGADALGGACDNGHTACGGGGEGHIRTVRVSQAGDALVSTGGLPHAYRRVSKNQMTPS